MAVIPGRLAQAHLREHELFSRDLGNPSMAEQPGAVLVERRVTPELGTISLFEAG